MFSPSSGSLNSVTKTVSSYQFPVPSLQSRTCYWELATSNWQLLLADCRIRLLRIDSQVFDCLLNGFGFDFLFAGQRRESCKHNVLGIDFEEIAQRGATFAASEAVGAKRHERTRRPLRNRLWKHFHV